MNTRFKPTPIALVISCTFAMAGISTVTLADPFVSASHGETENVIVITAKANAADAELANSITVISSEQIENSGATSLQDILKNISGFNFTVNSSSLSGRKNIGLRGMDSEHILILVDGERMSASDAFIGHSNFQSNWISLDNIDKIEIIKGSGSVLYGSEAIGGVINIITKSGAQKEFTRMAVSRSNLPNRNGGEASNAAVSGGQDLSNDLYLTGHFSYAKRASADPYRYIQESPYGSYEVEDVSFEESIVKNTELGLSYKLTGNTELTLNLNNSDEERNLAAPYYDIERKRYKLGLNTRLGQWNANFKAYNNESSFAWNSFGQSPYYTHVIEDAVVSGELQSQFSEDQYITLGLDNHQVDYFKDYADPQSTNDYRSKGTSQTSLYFQDNISIGKHFLNIGARIDDNSQFDTGFSSSIGYVHSLDHGLSLTISYTTAFLAPNIKEADSNYSFTQHGAGFSFRGNSELDPETSKNIEFGIKQRSKTIAWGISAYRNQVDDMITTAPVSPTEFLYSNVANATIKGLETTVHTDLSASLVLGGSYNYMDSDDGNGQDLAYRSRHNIKADLTHSLGTWTSVLSINYTGDSVYYATDENHNPKIVEVKAYTVFDLAINKEFSELFKIQLAINNIADETLSAVDDNYFTELLGREIKLSAIMTL